MGGICYGPGVCFALVYTAVVTPAEVGFVTDEDKVNDYMALFGVNMFVNAIFLCDVALQFFLHYQLPKEKGLTWVRNHKRIVTHYLKGYFCLDFFSSIPFGALGMMFPAMGDLAAARLLRLLRLAKLLRIMRSSRLINRYRADMSVSYGIIQLWGFVILAVIACHWMACLWGYTANASSSGFGNSWMTAFVRGDDDDNPLPKWNIRNPKHQYVISLYFAIMTLTTVGYGDVLAQNISEYALMIVMMFLGGFMWAYIIGSVCAVTATLDIKKIEHQQLYDQINNMLVDLAITRPLACAVRSFLFQTEEMERRIGYSALIDTLSPELQGLLSEEISAKRMASVKYFAGRTPKFRLQVFKRLRRSLYCPQELVHEDSLLIIANQGVVGAQGCIYTSGMALNLDFFLHRYRVESSKRALNYVEFEMLSNPHLLDILAICPGDRMPIKWIRVFFAMIRKVRYDARLAEDRRNKEKGKLDRANGNFSATAASFGDVFSQEFAHVHDVEAVAARGRFDENQGAYAVIGSADAPTAPRFDEGKPPTPRSITVKPASPKASARVQPEGMLPDEVRGASPVGPGAAPPARRVSNFVLNGRATLNLETAPRPRPPERTNWAAVDEERTAARKLARVLM